MPAAILRDAAEFIIGPRFARTRWRLLRIRALLAANPPPPLEVSIPGSRQEARPGMTKERAAAAAGRDRSNQCLTWSKLTTVPVGSGACGFRLVSVPSDQSARLTTLLVLTSFADISLGSSTLRPLRSSQKV